MAGAVVLAVALAVLFATAAMAATLAGFGGAPAVASEATAASPSAASHVARRGDTLWSIAGDYRGDVDQRRYVEALIELNGGTSIVAGQAVRLP